MKRKLLISILGIALVLTAFGVYRGKKKGQLQSQAKKVLDVGFLPVTCHLTCPVTDFATSRNPDYRFTSQ